MENRHNHLFFIVCIIALVAIFVYKGNSNINEKAKAEELYRASLQKTLSETTVGAHAISVYNVDTNEKVYGWNDTTPLPIASLAKILTVAIAVGPTNQDDIITITKDALDQTGDFGLFLGEKWKAGDLAKLTLISSANDGAFVLASKYLDFLGELNLRAKKLGASQTTFLNPTGLDIQVGGDRPALLAGVKASAEEVNQMAVFLFKKNPEIAAVTTKPEITLTSESGFTHTFKNTDVIVDKIPNLLFSKTGFTDVAGGNLTIIFKNKKGESIAITVLGSSFAGRFDDMQKLVNVLYNS
jgi:D-alanyl-D-alanine carboxypeptidase (penicillin-binding protein 5/6)